MNGRSAMYPEPPHIEAAFYLDRYTEREGLIRLCERLERAECVSTGAFDVFRSTRLPPFASLSDLAGKLEPVRMQVRRNRAPAWQPLLRDPEVQVVRAAFTGRPSELIVAGYGPAALATERHPVAATLSGAVLCVPAEVHQGKSERQQASQLARFLRELFQDTCAALDPLYAAISVEAYLPTPLGLSQNGSRMSTEVFLSGRLFSADPTLEQDFRSLFAGGSDELWETGRFFCGWPVFYPEQKQDQAAIPAPQETGLRAARRLAATLRQAR